MPRRKADLTSQFGARLQALRLEAGMTQEQLAERSGVSVRTIRRIETGKGANPSMTTVGLLAEALGLEPDELLNPPARPVKPPDPPRHDPLAGTADQLALAVGTRWRREEEQRQVQDPHPLPVRFENTAKKITDDWAIVCRTPPGETPGRLDLAGQLDGVVDVYQRVPSKRLVVLGRAGSGKTILTIRFVLDLLETRSRAAPVPVIFGLGSWNPATTSIYDWLTDQLMRDYPGLAAPGYGESNLAAALVDARRILPVLDGFDEIADGLRQGALRALNATTMPLLLTSRPAEYAAAVQDIDVLTAAAVIELSDLTVTDLANYLPLTTRKTTSANTADTSANVWGPVVNELSEQSPSPAGANLAPVLTTPLMVSLARTIYSDTRDRDPSVLLDTDRFATPEAIEAHLFDNFIPTVYRHQPGDHQPRWDDRRVQYWLGYLAKHLDQLGRRDLAWWQVGDTIGTSSRMLVVGVMAGLAIGFVEWLLAGLVSLLFAGPGQALTVWFGYGLVDALLVALAAGLAFALGHGLMIVYGSAVFEPSRARIRIRGGTREKHGRFFPRFRVGLLGGFVFGLGYGFVLGLVNWVVSGNASWLRVGLVDAIVFGLVFGPGAGLALGLMARMETPLDVRSAASPVDLLKTNRTTVVFQLLLFAPIFGLTIALGGAFVVELLQGILGPLRLGLDGALLWGLAGAFGGGLGYALGLTAWGRWVIFARVWLPLTGRLPWAVPAFLDDAYRRGVLRQAGAVYQFRHARLHDHLSRVYRARENS